MDALTLANGKTVRVGDFVTILRDVGGNGPRVGTHCRVVKISNDEVRVEFSEASSGSWGKHPDNIKLDDDCLMLDVGL